MVCYAVLLGWQAIPDITAKIKDEIKTKLLYKNDDNTKNG